MICKSVRVVLFGTLMVVLSSFGAVYAQEQETGQKESPAYEEALRTFRPGLSKTPKMPKALKSMIAKGAQSRFLGEYQGLHGWVVLQRGQPEFYYVTENGQAILRGFLFSGKGEMVTGEQLTQLRMREGANMYALSEMVAEEDESEETAGAAPPSPKEEEKKKEEEPSEEESPSEMFFKTVEQANWFAMGSEDTPSLYAFVDPDCPHCRKFIRAVKPYADRKLVHVRVIPVGFEKDAEKRASYLLAAPRPADLLWRYVEGDKTALFAPGSLSREGLERNLKVMNAWNLDATPIIVYKTPSGSVQVVRGKPHDIRSVVAHVRGES